jgi:trehalose 6-phosphate phosphatase
MVGFAFRDQGSLAVPPGALLEGATLLLDVDGTLLELARRPDLVTVDPALFSLLPALADRLEGRLALVSGRAASDVALLFQGIEVTIAGDHGCEIRFPGGELVAASRHPRIDEAIEAFADFAQARDGLLVEVKPHGVALHYREGPAFEEPCRELATELAASLGLHLQGGKMMVELRQGSCDKGTALNLLMERAPMKGTRPVFIGDDVTDEQAFAAAHALGGAGILVGPRRPTGARFALADVPAVHDWLHRQVSS